MPSIKLKDKQPAEAYKKLKADSKDLNDKGGCGVTALAATTGKTYKHAYRVLERCGRKHRHGTYFGTLRRAAKELGFKLVEINCRYFMDRYRGRSKHTLKNVTTHHPARFNKVWADGCNYIFSTKNHYAGVVDGVTIDWTKGQALQVRCIYRVVKIERKA